MYDCPTSDTLKFIPRTEHRKLPPFLHPIIIGQSTTHAMKMIDQEAAPGAKSDTYGFLVDSVIGACFCDTV